MKLARISYEGYNCASIVLEGGYRLLSPERWAGLEVAAEDAVLLAPTMPGKILGVGWNFRGHIKEMWTRTAGAEVAEEKARQMPAPLFFLKPPSSLIGAGEAIVYPKDATRVEYEGELAVVIGEKVRRVTPEDAPKAVLGWTCANDVTERDQQGKDKQWWRAKGYDTFAVAGPYLETQALEPDAWVRTRVNGEERQAAQVKDMIRDPYTIISLISQAMTLYPGDLIMLGTPDGVGELRPGDVVEVEVDGIGVLRNPVVLEE